MHFFRLTLQPEIVFGVVSHVSRAKHVVGSRRNTSSLSHTRLMEIKNEGFTLKMHQMLSIQKLHYAGGIENAEITGHFAVALKEHSGMKIT